MVDVGGRYGLSERTDVGGTAHLFPLLVDPPIAGGTVWVAHQVMEESGLRPALSTGVSASGFFGQAGSHILLDVPVTASWMVGDSLLYAGAHGTLLPGRFQATSSGPVGVTPFAGAEVLVGESRSIGVGAELTWYRAGLDSRDTAVDWARINGRGAVGYQARVRFYPGRYFNGGGH
jgi:hypothetical protein